MNKLTYGKRQEEKVQISLPVTNAIEVAFLYLISTGEIISSSLRCVSKKESKDVCN